MNNKQDLPNDSVWNWFELTYSAYLVLPRVALCSMPGSWQDKFVALLKEMEECLEVPEEHTGEFWVRMKGEGGKFKKDPLSDYRRHPLLTYNKRK